MVYSCFWFVRQDFLFRLRLYKLREACQVCGFFCEVLIFGHVLARKEV